jgi:hypothetical protein
MAKTPQREITVEIDGQTHTGRLEIGDFFHGVHTITVWYRGKKATRPVPPEVVDETSYIDFLSEEMLTGLVQEQLEADS